MSTITYNAELKFKDITDQEYWTSLLEVSRLAYNECADIITTRKVHLDLQSVHNAVYYELREKFPTIPSQGIIKIYKDCISAFRSINSNGHVEHKVPINHFYTFLPIKYVLVISCFIVMHCSCVSKNCNLMSLGLV